MKNKKFNIDFIGIGASRSATSWIFRCLQEHPEICVSKIKEANFFNTENYYKGIDYYKWYFNHCNENKIKGEFSPGYLIHPKTSYFIKKHFPNVKLIVCLRNPIDALYSTYLFGKYRGKHNYSTFEQFIKNEPYLLKERMYFTHLKRYFQLFPRINILILIYEDIYNDPVKFIQSIYKFLKVDENFIPKNVYKKINAEGEYKIFFISKILYKMMNILKKSKWGESCINRIFRSRIKSILDVVLELHKQDIENFQLPSSNIKPSTRKYLKDFYKPEIEKLEKLIARDLSFWN